MIKVGKRQVLFSATLLCPEGEEIEIEVPVPGETKPWKIKIVFSNKEQQDSDKSDLKPTLTWEIVEDNWILNFSNWNKTLGSAISKPAQIAETINNQPITLLAEVSKLTGLYRANIQLMLQEGENG